MNLFSRPLIQNNGYLLHAADALGFADCIQHVNNPAINFTAKLDFGWIAHLGGFCFLLVAVFNFFQQRGNFQSAFVERALMNSVAQPGDDRLRRVDALANIGISQPVS